MLLGHWLQKHQTQIYFRNPAETHGDEREIMSSKMRMERHIINRWRKTILLLPDVTLNSAKFLSTMNWKERHLIWSLVLREGNIANLWVSQKLQWQRICLIVPETQRYGFETWVRKIPWSWKWQPTQYSCLENSMDREAWWATVYGIAKSWAKLSDWAHTIKQPMTAIP